MTSTCTLVSIIAELEQRYPPRTAEPWDAVGLVCGDPTHPIAKVLLAVDVTDSVVTEAIEWGADLLITHHPLLLRPVSSVAATTWKGALVHRLIRASCALYTAHTNADVADGGVAAALADLLGLEDQRPLVPVASAHHDGEPPHENAEATTGTGRVGNLPQPVTLGDFAVTVAKSLPATAQGVRVAGPLDAQVQKVALVGGSGDGFFNDVRRAGADVYITSDIRHHPISELREQADFEAAGGADSPPYVIDTAHFASEWPWLRLLAEQIRSFEASRAGNVEVKVSHVRTDAWTARIDSVTGEVTAPVEQGARS